MLFKLAFIAIVGVAAVAAMPWNSGDNTVVDINRPRPSGNDTAVDIDRPRNGRIDGHNKGHRGGNRHFFHAALGPINAIKANLTVEQRRTLFDQIKNMRDKSKAEIKATVAAFEATLSPELKVAVEQAKAEHEVCRPPAMFVHI